MCHGVVKWILEMLGIPKHKKVQEQHSLFYYFEEEILFLGDTYKEVA